MKSEGFTMFMEPKALYNSPIAATSVPEDFEVPFGKARVRMEGSDMTVLTYGNASHMCLQAAGKLAIETGASIEVIDLRSLIPLDKETILNSVKKTGKVLVVHEDKVFSGFGGELSAMITEEAFEYLDGPVRRVGSLFTPVGFNRILEKAILPDADKIEKAMKELLDF
jgi:2-oxoisovalerate dehydrogenase E1 component